MTSLSDKLKALGVKIGTDGVEQTSKSPKYPIESIVEGEEIDTPFGLAYVIEEIYKTDPRTIDLHLKFTTSLANLSTWIGNPDIVHHKPESFTFLDTETSGLAGGTGTYAFLIGIGKFTDDGFRLSQYFLRDPFEEPAQLAAVLGALNNSEVLVTYNGKSFDVPLLNTRYITNGELPPLNSLVHIDLLHLARRLWRDRLESRTLGSIEENILGAHRTEEDIPGWMVPSIYFDYIKTGDARPITNVLYHNAMDILSLTTLLNHISTILDDPHGVELPTNVHRQAIYRWSIMEKRRDNIGKSIQLWRNAAEYKELYAHEELAKVFEHRIKDYPKAIYWTELAIEVTETQRITNLDRNIWQSKLEHRLNRLLRKYKRTRD
jgi:uncharacterized protein YprB with RNaseH-like and TPR domain